MAFQLSGYVNAPDQPESASAVPACLLTGTIDAVTLDIPVDAVTFLPPSSTRFVLLIGTEKIPITSRTSLTLHAESRGSEGTTAAIHVAGAKVWNAITALSLARHPRSMTELGDLSVMGVDGAPVRFAAPANGDYGVRWTGGVPSWVAVGGGGNLSGTLTAGRIPFASGAQTLIDDPNLTWVVADSELLIGDASISGNGGFYGKKFLMTGDAGSHGAIVQASVPGNEVSLRISNTSEAAGANNAGIALENYGDLNTGTPGISLYIHKDGVNEAVASFTYGGTNDLLYISGTDVPEMGNDLVIINPATGNMTVKGNQTLLKVTMQTPASASVTGVKDTFAFDTDFLYVCTALDTWKRVAIATW